MTTRTRGTLLFVDGIDGAGKSTLIDALAESFLDKDFQYYEHYNHITETFKFPSKMPAYTDKTDPLTSTLFYVNDFRNSMRSHRRTDQKLDTYRIFDRSFVTTMAYQGFNTQQGEPLTNPFFEAIFRFGASALLSNQTVKDLQRKKDVYFLSVKCNPEVAAERVLDRTTDRVGEIEDIEEESELIERLATLQDRFSLCYSHIRMNIAQLWPENNYSFLEVDSTVLNSDMLLETTMGHLSPLIWPQQQALF